MMLAWQRHFLPLLLAMLLCACAQRPVAGLPGAEALQQKQVLTQQMEARWKDSSGSLLTILQVENGEVNFLATTLMGQEIFHVRYDGVSPVLVSRSDVLPRSFRADYLLRDLLWAQWPADSLRPALEKNGLMLSDTETTRTINARANKGGEVVLIIQRAGPGVFRIENPRFGYVLNLSPADTGANP